MFSPLSPESWETDHHLWRKQGLGWYFRKVFALKHKDLSSVPWYRSWEKRQTWHGGSVCCQQSQCLGAWGEWTPRFDGLFSEASKGHITKNNKIKFKRMGEKNSKIKKSGQLLKLSSEPYTYGYSWTHVNNVHTQYKTDILSLSVFTALATNPLSCWRSYQMLAPTCAIKPLTHPSGAHTNPAEYLTHCNPAALWGD